MPKKISAMDIYKLLPKTNCKKCGQPSCMAFATKLLEREATVDQCPVLNTPKFEENRKKIIELISPPVKEVWFGNNERKAVLGGDEVMYRYQLSFFNPTPIGIDISDELSEEEIKNSGLVAGYVGPFGLDSKINYIIDDDGLKNLQDNNQIIFRYCDENGNVDVKFNPNGAKDNIAGISNKKGNILGIMPHPERAAESILPSQDGKGIFQSIENYVKSYI